MMKIAGSESGSGSIIQRHGSADPDPHQSVMDPLHWFKTICVMYLVRKRWKSKEKNRNYLWIMTNDQGRKRFWFRPKKFQTISCLCTGTFKLLSGFRKLFLFQFWAWSICDCMWQVTWGPTMRSVFHPPGRRWRHPWRRSFTTSSSSLRYPDPTFWIRISYLLTLTRSNPDPTYKEPYQTYKIGSVLFLMSDVGGYNASFGTIKLYG